MDIQWKPKAWLAILLGLFFQPFVFLYVNQFKYFIRYFICALIIAAVDVFLHSNYFPFKSGNMAWLQHIYLSWLFIVICPIHGFIIARRYDITQPRRWYARWWIVLASYALMMLPLIVLRGFFFEPFSIPASSMKPTLAPGNHVLVSKYGFGNYRYLGFQLAKSTPSVTPARGDILVFQYPANPTIDYVKRVIGLPGDRIIYRDKTIFLQKACNVSREACAGLDSQYDLIDKTLLPELSTETQAVYQESLDDIHYQVLLLRHQKELVDRYYVQENTLRGEWLVPAGQYFVLGDNRDNSLDSRYFGFIPQDLIIGKVIYIW
ncbi:signal peptidase I [Shewanella baltica]|nr:signal peptidase I [Shewanella baltica]MCS6225322.1 signal peptidase I [Shewanella baltica]